MFINAFGVMRASGQCSLCGGDVAVGSNFTPSSTLHVDGFARIGRSGSTSGELDFQRITGTVFTLATSNGMTTQKYYLPTAMPTSSADQLVCNTAGELSWAAPGTVSNAWMRAGNAGTNPATDYLGTQNSADLVLRTNATERMRVLAGGNVGIGQSTPAALLHIGDGGSSTVMIEKSSAGEAKLSLFADQGTPKNGNLRYNSDETLILENTGSNNNIEVSVNEGGIQTTALFIEGNSTNVGIGTSAPLATLHVHAMNGTSQLARYTVNNKSGSLTLTDPEATYYRPTISGISANGNVSALHLMANVLAADDDVADTKPMMVFESKRYSSGANIVNRPLFEWRNNQTARMTMLADGNLGIGTAAPSGKLHVAGGNIRATGIPAGAGTEDVLGIEADGDFVNVTQSSIHFKQNVQELSFDKEAYFSMDAVRFDWKEIYGGNPDVGFIAQQVEETFPEMGIYRHKRFYLDNGDFVRDSLGEPVVDTTQMEVRGVRYHKLPVYLYELAKQQEALNVELQQRLTELEERLNYCCAIQPSLRLGTEEEPMASDVKSYVLDQNDPNPFSDYTSIFVSVPQDVKSAQLMITGMNGRIIKVIDLEAGQSERLMVYSSEIGKGLFSYSLLLDGKVVETKKMASIR